MTNFIMRLLLTCEIRQLQLVNDIRNYLAVHAVYFCHELYNFASSPYDINDYDRNVEHTYYPKLHSMFIICHQIV